MPAELVSTVTDAGFLEAKASIGRPSAGPAGAAVRPGVRELLDDLELTLRVLDAQHDGASSTRPGKGEVRALAAALRAEADVLVRRPELLRQKLVNRLRWTAPALAESFVDTAAPAAPRWLRVLSPPGDPPAPPGHPQRPRAPGGMCAQR